MNILRKSSLLLAICFMLSSCTLFRGGGDLDTSLTEGFPISIGLEQEGFGKNRMPKKARWYRAYWGAITVGDIYVAIIPTKEGYGIRSTIRSKGLAKAISGWKSDAGATMNFAEPDQYSSIRYKTSFQLRKKKRKIDINWDKHGAIISDTNEPSENPDKRPLVMGSDKVGVYDPLTAIMVARSEVRSAILSGRKSFKVPVYDGRRRFNMLFDIHGANKKGNIHVSFVEQMISGYTNNEVKDIKKRNARFHIFLSPHDLLPVAAKGESLIGTAYVRLKKECNTLKECMKKE